MVNASRGKIIRAEPVQKLYEDGRVHHVGTFPELEKEMRTYTQGSTDSPNRMDALVWTISELFMGAANVTDQSAFTPAQDSPDMLAMRRRSLRR